MKCNDKQSRYFPITHWAVSNICARKTHCEYIEHEISVTYIPVYDLFRLEIRAIGQGRLRLPLLPAYLPDCDLIWSVTRAKPPRIQSKTSKVHLGSIKGSCCCSQPTKNSLLDRFWSFKWSACSRPMIIIESIAVVGCVCLSANLFGIFPPALKDVWWKKKKMISCRLPQQFPNEKHARGKKLGSSKRAQNKTKLNCWVLRNNYC